jgi:hypothetical protein
MADIQSHRHEPTAVDDVRRVRERIAEHHHGNMREHMEETNRIFEQLRAKLNLKVVSPADDSRRSGTTG